MTKVYPYITQADLCPAASGFASEREKGVRVLT